MSIYVDYKITTWRRAHFKDGSDLEKIKEALEDFNSGDVFDEELGFTEDEYLFETQEELSLDQNDGYSTIELHEVTEDIDKIIYQNGL